MKSTDFEMYSKQIQILLEKADLIIEGCNDFSKKNACIKKIDTLSETEKFSIVGPISYEFAKPYHEYLSEYSKVQFSGLEYAASNAFSFLGFGKNIDSRQKDSSEKTDALDIQIKDYENVGQKKLNAK